MGYLIAKSVVKFLIFFSPLIGTNSILRRIDLTCNILAPVSTGLILDYGSTLIGVLFIAGWNLISVFVEYTMLSAVYRSCQGLASKAVDVNRFESTLSNSDPDLVNVDLSENDQDGTLLVPRVKTGRSLRMSCGSLLEKIKSRVRILRFGLKVFFQQRVAFAGIGLACLYLTVLGFDSITTAYAYSQHVSAMALGFLTGAGALTGILGTFIFPKFRQMFGLVKTGLISNAIQLFFLMLCVASVWAPGHPGHLLDPNYHGDGTGKMTKFANVSILPTENLVNTTSTIPWTIASTIRPTPTVHLSPTPNKSSLSTLSKNIKPSMTIPVSPSTTITNLTKTRNNKKNTKHSGDSEENNSLISLGLLMGGIVMSRIGLWMTDLVITQLFQENVPEQERGIVSGVQNSFNSIMDVAHFVLVTVAPKPEEFGVLILISVIMVSIGFAFYSRFAWNHRKRLIQLEKLSHWSASNESVEGTSQRLRDESRSNSRTDLSSGVLSVKNDNYSLES
jgi:iron-regulated transporter 1